MNVMIKEDNKGLSAFLYHFLMMEARSKFKIFSSFFIMF